MTKSNSSNFTRGGQLWAHNVRMTLQGLRSICIVGLIFVLLILAFRTWQKMDFETSYYFAIERFVQLKLEMFHFLDIKRPVYVEFYSLNKGMNIKMLANQFIEHFWFKARYGVVITLFWRYLTGPAIFEIATAFAIGCIVAFVLFRYRGISALGNSKMRGASILSSEKLAALLKRKRKASKIQISGLPLVKDTETQHLLLTGTTGSGKTNMLKELLPQIRKNHQRAIIIDVTGEFFDRFYNPETDIVLNPLRENSKKWLPWNDCSSDEEFNSLASTFVDGESMKTDRYWEDAARSVFVEALKKEKDSKDLDHMLDVINRAEFSEFCEYFAGTDAAGYVSKEADKATASVRSTLITKIERLKLLQADGEFSIKEWVNRKNDNGWLFVTSTPNELDTLRPLISAWTNIAIKGLFDRPHSQVNDKMWLVMDELPAMHKIPSLSLVLGQGRKYGACVVAGIQNIAQVNRIYGTHGAREILDLFRSKFFFAVSDPDIAEYASKVLGDVEVTESNEQLTYGANTIRDGVNINSVQKVKKLILPDEIKNLEPLSCFVKLAGNYPITKLKVDLQKQKNQSSLFLKALTPSESEQDFDRNINQKEN